MSNTRTSRIKLVKSRFKPTKGQYEPWLITISMKESPFTVVAMFYECPHCGLLFRNRSTCEKHSKGVEGQFLPTCEETHKYGKCEFGCKHK